MVDIRAIQAASEIIKGHIHRTPLIYSNSFSMLTGAEVFIKAENLQKTGSFKVRGAFNKLMNIHGQSVITASMGNHAQAVAFVSSRLGINAKIVMPLTVSIVKEEATKAYGAEVLLYGENFQDALNYALFEKGYIFIHAFDDEDIIAGQGTIGLEIMEDLRDIDYVLVPVGGGGLISGVAISVKALSPKTKVVGIQTESATSAYVSFKERKITSVTPSPTIADGIAVGQVGDRTFDIMTKYVDEMILAKEDSIAGAILFFLERKKLVVEGAGAVPLAILMEEKEKFKGKRVVLVVSGGNIDFTLVDRIIHKGLVISGRIGLFEVIVDDVPGSLHSLIDVISSRRGNIMNVVHDRLAVDLSIGKTRVIFTVEVRNKEHLEEILSDFASRGFEVGKRTGE
ncbi:MAG: threonine ammonia-lyase [Nitrospirota bacterium]